MISCLVMSVLPDTSFNSLLVPRAVGSAVLNGGTATGSERFTEWFDVRDGEHEDDFTELAIPAKCSHGVAV